MKRLEYSGLSLLALQYNCVAILGGLVILVFMPALGGLYFPELAVGVLGVGFAVGVLAACLGTGLSSRERGGLLLVALLALMLAAGIGIGMGNIYADLGRE